MVNNINSCKMDEGRWAVKGGGKQEARELGAKPGQNVL